MDRVVMKDGTVLVTREECDRWPEDIELREAVREAGGADISARVFAVCTTGGYVVDVWQVDHWQSGAEFDDGSVGWSEDMYKPNW